MLAPDEEDVRQILGAMMMAFHSQPTRSAEFFIDALVMEVMEPEGCDPFSLPAVAAAARELWQTLPSPPSIAEFLPSVKKHHARLESVHEQLRYILEAAERADGDLIKPDDDPDFIPF
jgi:hypothetical protein